MLRHFFLVGTYFCLSLVLTWPLGADPAGSLPIPVHIHDRPWVHIYWSNLWWLWHYSYSLFVQHTLPFFSDLVFYPVGIESSVYCFQNLIPGIAFAFISLLNSNALFTANSIILLGLTFSAYATSLLASYCIQHRGAGFVSGLAFMASSPLLANAQGNITIIASIPFLPLFILFLVKTSQEKGIGNVIALTLCIACLFCLYWYYLFFCFLVGLLYLGVLRIDRGAAARLTPAVLINVLWIIPVLWLIQSQSAFELSSSIDVLQKWSVDLAALVIPGADHSFLGSWSSKIRLGFGANPTIQSAYLGFSLMFLAVVAWIYSPWKKIKLWTCIFISFALLSLGPILHINGQSQFTVSGHEFTIPLPLSLLYTLPVFSSIRDCSIYLHLAFLALAVLSGFGFHALASRISSQKMRRALYAGTLGLILFDFSIIPFPLLPSSIPSFYQTLSDETPAQKSIIDVPLSYKMKKYFFLQTLHKKPMLQGCFTRGADFYNDFAEDIILYQLFAHPSRVISKKKEISMLSTSDIAFFQNLFQVDTIILHKHFLSPEIISAFQEFVQDNFLLEHILDEDGHTVFRLEYLGSFPSSFSQRMNVEFNGHETFAHLKKGWTLTRGASNSSLGLMSDPSSSLMVFIPHRKDYRLQIKVRLANKDITKQHLSILWNDHVLDIKELSSPEWLSVQVHVPQQRVHAGINTISFHKIDPSPVVFDSVRLR